MCPGVVSLVPRRRSTTVRWWHGWRRPQQHSEALGVAGRGHSVCRGRGGVPREHTANKHHDRVQRVRGPGRGRRPSEELAAPPKSSELKEPHTRGSQDRDVAPLGVHGAVLGRLSQGFCFSGCVSPAACTVGGRRPHQTPRAPDTGCAWATLTADQLAASSGVPTTTPRHAASLG